MVRKSRAQGVSEIAVMEVAQVGIRTRTQAEAAMTAAAAATSTSTSTSTLAKRRKLNSEQVRHSSSYIQLRNHTINTGTETASVGGCWSPGLELSDHDRVSTSSCSSNGSSERIEFVDLKDESVEVEVEVETSTYYSGRERRETTPFGELEAETDSGNLDSTAKPSSEEANSCRGSTVEKMPTETEIEDFFAEAEKKLLKQFSEKYNFDFAKEEPMEGRYEWVRLKP